MEDPQIISLYWQREESAIRETENKYGPYLTRIAHNILFDREDSRESVNDTYLAAWETMPPHRPEALSAYLAMLTRRISIDRLRMRTRKKRIPSEYTVSLSELEDCVSGSGSPEEVLDSRLLAEAIGTYLRTVSKEARTVFVARYFFLDPVRQIAASHGITESKCKSLLHRTRLGLREHLKKEGFDL